MFKHDRKSVESTSVRKNTSSILWNPNRWSRTPWSFWHCLLLPTQLPFLTHPWEVPFWPLSLSAFVSPVSKQQPNNLIFFLGKRTKPQEDKIGRWGQLGRRNLLRCVFFLRHLKTIQPGDKLTVHNTKWKKRKCLRACTVWTLKTAVGGLNPATQLWWECLLHESWVSLSLPFKNHDKRHIFKWSEQDFQVMIKNLQQWWSGSLTFISRASFRYSH